MVEFAINNSVHALTTHRPFFVNGLLHLRLPIFLECDSSFKGEGITRANVNPDLNHHVLTMRSLHSTPISITSTSVKEMKLRVISLLLTRILIKISITPSESNYILCSVNN